MAVLAARFFEHIEQVAHLAEQTCLENTRTCGMVESYVAYIRDEFKKLKKSVREGICNMCFQTRERRLIVEPIQSISCCTSFHGIRENSPKVEVIDTKPTVLDLNIAVFEERIIVRFSIDFGTRQSLGSVTYSPL